MLFELQAQNGWSIICKEESDFILCTRKSVINLFIIVSYFQISALGSSWKSFAISYNVMWIRGNQTKFFGTYNMNEDKRCLVFEKLKTDIWGRVVFLHVNQLINLPLLHTHTYLQLFTWRELMWIHPHNAAGNLIFNQKCSFLLFLALGKDECLKFAQNFSFMFINTCNDY